MTHPVAESIKGLVESHHMEVLAEMKRIEKESLQWFMERMGEKLTENAHKWKRRPWTQKPDEHLMLRLIDELKELMLALGEHPMKPKDVICECADVANFAMMIARNTESRRKKQ